MMMMKQCRENVWREQQYKNSSEQQEREYQLCWEEMVIAREDACAQGLLMNMMFMSMMNRTRGDNRNPPSSPRNTL